MQDSVSGLQTDQWSQVLSTVVDWIWAGLSWIVAWQAYLFGWLFTGDSVWAVIGKFLLLVPPAAVLVAGVWGTMVSLYTLPFRLGRAGSLLTGLLMSWWDGLRMAWFYWAGLVRFLVVLAGWVWGLLKLAVQLVWGTVKGAVTSPLAMLDATSRRPGVPWPAFFLLVVWSAIEATIFTFTLQPTLNEVFGGLTGFEPNPAVMAPLLWFFLFMLVAGSFACVQVVTEAIKEKKVGTIVQMLVVESAVMFFEVIFLYRELIDAVTPWIAQQSGGEVQLGIVAVLSLASFGWLGVRGMSWFLFGRFGTPALLAILSRETISQEDGARHVASPVQPEMWRAPVNALKAETAWFHEEAKRMFELLSLPVLQLLAAAINFAVVAVQSRPMFSLPFKSLEDILAATPRPHLESGSGMRTPHEPRTRVA